jgi:hypothetical protein
MSRDKVKKDIFTNRFSLLSHLHNLSYIALRELENVSGNQSNILHHSVMLWGLSCIDELVF